MPIEHNPIDIGLTDRPVYGRNLTKGKRDVLVAIFPFQQHHDRIGWPGQLIAPVMQRNWRTQRLVKVPLALS